MKKCKNCQTEIEEHRTYCSYKCRNIYVNKNYRDYDKLSNDLIDRYHKEYNENPKYCITCGIKIEYEHRHNKFCSNSCSAKNNNKKRKGEKRNFTKEGLKNIQTSNMNRIYIKNGTNIKEEYNRNPKKCLCCDNLISYKKRDQIFCNNDCKYEYYRKNRTEMENYIKECTFNFNLNDYPNEFDFSLIEKHGWYKAKNHGDNLKGVSRDHMFSVMEGFRQNINPILISHPANCKLMLHQDNSSKWNKCSITIEELKDRIVKWNDKYRAR